MTKATPGARRESVMPRWRRRAAWRADSRSLAAEPVVAVAQARQLTPGLLVSGQPTPEALEQAKARGFRTVINLRAPGEAGAWEEGPKALSLGLRYLALPIPNAEALTEENARRLAAVLNDPESDLD